MAFKSLYLTFSSKRRAGPYFHLKLYIMKPVIENAPKVGSRHFMSLVYLLVLTLCLTLVNMGNAQNLLNNPSFETGNLNSWSNHNSRTVTGHNQCSSTYAAWINHTGSGSSTYNYISQEVSASPGKRYALNFRAQQRNSHPNRARLQAIDASGNVLSEQNTEIDRSSWSSYELVVVGVPDGTVKVRARIETNNGGQVKVDCFDLRENVLTELFKSVEV